jgi:hypothetical protein
MQQVIIDSEAWIYADVGSSGAAARPCFWILGLRLFFIVPYVPWASFIRLGTARSKGEREKARTPFQWEPLKASASENEEIIEG